MIKLENVTKAFNLTGAAEDTRIALDNVNLTINDGEFVTIIGGNGSGKSTSINIICGSLMPDKGHVILSGMDITKMPEHKRAKYFGRVFQDPMMGTTAEMSCLENLEIAFRRGKSHSPIRWGFSNNVVRRYFKKLLSEFHLGLEDRLDQKVGVMSGGQRQALTLLMAATDPRLDTRSEFVGMCVDIRSGKARIELNKAIASKDREAIRSAKQKLSQDKVKAKEIASVFYDKQLATYKSKCDEIKAMDLSNDEKEEKLLDCYIEFSNSLHEFNQDRRILLLDEHTAALDPKTADKVLKLTNKIVREKNLTTLMVTHNMRDALLYGDRLIMFYNGHIIHDFNKEEKAKLSAGDLLKFFDEADKNLINK